MGKRRRPATESERKTKAPGPEPPAPAATSTAIPRLALAGIGAYGLTTAALLSLAPCLSFPNEPFFYFAATAALAKLLGDLVYYLLWPRFREWVRLDDYLANDFFLFARFALPLAIIQTLALVKGVVPLPLTGLWSSPIAATALYLVNRGLVEQAQIKRRSARGGIPSVRGPRQP